MAASGCAGFVGAPARCVNETKHSPGTTGRKMTSGETEPRTEREYAMACQCNRCVGTGKCSACSGTGEAAAREVLTSRRPKLHRFEFPGPQFYGIWRYQAVPPVVTSAKPLTEGVTVAKPVPAPANPECAGDRVWPCSAECWRPCAQCGKLICERHDYLVPVWPPENGACDRADMICRECVVALWARGDISQSAQVQYLC